MIIALDFDETYTKDPMLWNYLILGVNHDKLKANKIIMATYRHEKLDYDPLFEILRVLGVDCYFTDGKAKKPFLQNLGIEVDIWIDDNPLSIMQDSAWKHDSPELHAWREENKKKTA